MVRRGFRTGEVVQHVEVEGVVEAEDGYNRYTGVVNQHRHGNGLQMKQETYTIPAENINASQSFLFIDV